MRTPINHALALGLLLLVLGPGCQKQEEQATPAPPDTCDAGDEAFVARAIPLLWGRKPHSYGEVRAWTDAIAASSREAVIRAMTHDPAYLDHWQDWVIDALGVARIGDRAYGVCFGAPSLLEDTGELARFIASSPAQGPSYPEPFNMADVVRSGLQQDDLSVAWRVNLFARMNRPLWGANVGPEELEANRRTAFGDEFMSFYLHRNLTCLTCHNSEYSVTGSSDPALDRTWEIPGLFEQALLGQSFGISQDTAYAVFRYTDLLDPGTATEAPWGIAPACGRFTPADQLTDDYLDHEGYFIQAFGESGSVWQVEAFLQQGVEDLSQTGLLVDDQNDVDGPMAFAWLVGASITDQVWQTAMGQRLTIANYFPRIQGQRDRLSHLTSALVEQHFSLRTLLVEVTADPLFNAGAPSSCASKPYGLEPVIDPWVVAEEDPALRLNGPGDLVHRYSARVLIRSVHDSLGWAQPAAFLASRDPVVTLQSNLGAYMRVSQPGFNGSDFQGILAFENTYGACMPPETGGAGNGCQATPGHAGCASCGCQSCVCTMDPYCCDVQWDSICVSMCNESCGGCGGGLADAQNDTITRILAGAIEQGRTVGEVVLALKDRLITQGAVTTEEQALMETLLEAHFADPITPALEPALRVLCGAILLSPRYFLAQDPGSLGPVPALALDVGGDCERMTRLMALEGVTVSCPEGRAP